MHGSGYKKDVPYDNIYINSNNVISINDYMGVNQFLISEGEEKLAENDYCLIKINEGQKVQEIIAFGTAKHIYSLFSGQEKGLLHG